MSDSIDDRAVNITACLHPFKVGQKKLSLPEGGSIADMLRAANISGTGLRIACNDVSVPDDQRGSYYPRSGDIIAVRAAVGDADADNPWRMIAQLAVTAAAIYIGGPSGAAVGVMGNLAVNALLPPPQAANVKQESTLERNFAITGTRNASLPFGCVPRVCGRARIFPPRAAAPVTFIRDNKHCLREIYCLGPGPLDKSSPKIGETDANADNFPQFQIEYLTGDQASVLYPDQTTQEEFTILLPTYGFDHSHGNYYGIGFDHYLTAWTTKTTETFTERVQLDFEIPSLMYFNDEGGRSTVVMVMLVEISPTGLDDWERLSGPFPASYVTTVESENWVLNTDWGWFTIEGADPNMIRASISFSLDTPGQYDIRVKRIRTYVSAGGEASGWLDEANQDRMYDDIYWTATKSIGNGENGTPPVLPDNGDMEFVAIELQATDQFHGTVDTFNMVCQAHHPVYNGSSWSVLATRNPAWVYASVLTDSANKRALAYNRLDGDNLLAFADACAIEGYTFDAVLSGRAPVYEVLKQISAIGRAAPAMPDGLHGVVMDVEQTTPVQSFSTRNSWEYKGTRVFSDIPHALRCKFSDTDGQPEERVVCDDGYGYEGGETPPTKFESMDMAGVSDPDHAWKLGRYHLAVMRLRPEIHSFSTDIEHMVCTRGDLIEYNHHGPSWGLKSARIQNISIAGTDVEILVDEMLTMQAGTDYGIRVRTLSDPVAVQVTTVPGNTYSLSCTLPTETSALLAADDLLMFGELNAETVQLIVKEIVPGPNMSATIYAVDAAPAVHTAHTGTIPAFDPHITLPPNPVLYPPPDPMIQRIVSDESVMMVDTTTGDLISRMHIDYSMPVVDGDNAPVSVQVQYRIAHTASTASIWAPSTAYAAGDYVVPATANGLEYACFTAGTSGSAEPTWPTEINDTVTDGTAQWVCVGSSDGAAVWQNAQMVSFEDGLAVVYPVAQGLVYDVRIRFFNAQGIPSGWVYTEHTIVGATNPPGTPTGIDGTPWMNGLKFTWDFAPEIDFKHWTVRTQVESEGWTDWIKTQTPVEYVFLNDTQSEAYPNGATVYIEIIAYDRAGNASGTASANDTTGSMYIPPATLEDFEDISKAFYEVPVLRDFLWASNSPGAGYVAWTSGTVWYNGTAYAVGSFNTSDHYIYWTPESMVFSTTDDDTAIPEGAFLIAVNNSGTYSLVWNNAVANQVFGSAWIRDASILSAKIHSLDASKIIADTVLTPGVYIGDAKYGDGTVLDNVQPAEANATAGADWATNLSSIPTRFGDAPGSAGLYVTASYLGYYNGSAWNVFIHNSGQFQFYGDSNNNIIFNGTALSMEMAGNFYLRSGGDMYIDSGGQLTVNASQGISVNASGGIQVNDGCDIQFRGITTNYSKAIFYNSVAPANQCEMYYRGSSGMAILGSSQNLYIGLSGVALWDTIHLHASSGVSVLNNLELSGHVLIAEGKNIYLQDNGISSFRSAIRQTNGYSYWLPNYDNTYYLHFGASSYRWANVTVQSYDADTYVSWTTISDRSTKENIVDLPGCATDVLMALRPRKFDKGDRVGEVGYIAQEVQQVIFEAVRECKHMSNPDGDKTEEKLLGVVYDHINPYIVKGFQEQKTRVDSIEDRLAVLESK